jgi:hypothetical protein
VPAPRTTRETHHYEAAQKILGHTRISVTLEIYTDMDSQARQDALTRLDEDEP